MKTLVVPGVPQPSPWPASWTGLYECVVVGFNNPTNFTYTTALKYKELCAFEEQLSEDLAKKRGGPHTLYSISGLYAIDNRHSAVRVKLIKIEDGEATVELIDRGITSRHSLSDLERLPHEYIEVPKFSTKAFLSDVKPFLGQRWEQICCQYYQRALENRKVYIQIIGEHPTIEGHEVRLFCHDNNTNMASRLISEGYARKGEYEYCLINDIRWVEPEEMEELLEEEEAAGNMDADREEQNLREHHESLQNHQNYSASRGR